MSQCYHIDWPFFQSPLTRIFPSDCYSFSLDEIMNSGLSIL